MTALVSNGLFIGLLTLVPFSVGRLALFLKVRRPAPPERGALAARGLRRRRNSPAAAQVQAGAMLRRTPGSGPGPTYSDGVTLLIG